MKPGSALKRGNLRAALPIGRSQYSNSLRNFTELIYLQQLDLVCNQPLLIRFDYRLISQLRNRRAGVLKRKVRRVSPEKPVFISDTMLSPRTFRTSPYPATDRKVIGFHACRRNGKCNFSQFTGFPKRGSFRMAAAIDRRNHHPHRVMLISLQNDWITLNCKGSARWQHVFSYGNRTETRKKPTAPSVTEPDHRAPDAAGRDRRFRWGDPSVRSLRVLTRKRARRP